MQGPQSASATGPAAPALARWMCAATALPLSPRKASFHVITGRPFVSITSAEKLPFASAGTPFGAGVSAAARRPVAIPCDAPSWPRISPPPFRFVWTLT